MTERLLSVGEVDLCVETFGSPSDPTILLIHGACASMLWWPQAFCAAFAGPSPFFDAVATRRLAAADVARTVCLDAALTNHFAMRIDGPRAGGPADIAVPTLVVHGDVDPVHPLPHGQALADAIPGATLLVLPHTGHDLPPQHIGLVVDALVAHTS